MDINEVEKHLISAIEAAQRGAGRVVPKITVETKPLSDIPGFDSYSGVTAIHELEDEIKEDLSDIPHLYFMDKKNRYTTVKDAAKAIYEFLNRKRRKT